MLQCAAKTMLDVASNVAEMKSALFYFTKAPFCYQSLESNHI